jgi:hypothetical protein
MGRFTAFAAGFTCGGTPASLNGGIDAIRERYAQYIDSCSFAGCFESSDGAKVAFIAVKLPDEKAVEGSPHEENRGLIQYPGLDGIMQGRFLSRLLSYSGMDAVIAAFYSGDKPVWRLSFVEKAGNFIPAEDFTTARNFTATGDSGKTVDFDPAGAMPGIVPVRRCSFIVGKGAPHQILKKRLRRLCARFSTDAPSSSVQVYPSIRELRQAFSRKEIAEEFIGECAKQHSKEFVHSMEECFVPPVECRALAEKLAGIPLWKRYDFSLRESTPYEETAAIDGNVLGILFESLLDGKTRKRHGTFYTRTEIARYMCIESISNCLANKTNVPYADLWKFLQYGEWLADENRLPETVLRHSVEIDNALASLRILDPAAGSGIFPLTLLHEIVKARLVLAECQLHRIPARDGRERADFIRSRSPYELKRNAIEHCLYATDIDREAIRLTELRLQMSLACEQESGFPALQSFRCNAVCADSLLGGLEWADFDIILGNPPYISAVEASRKDREMRQALKQKYPLLKGSFDVYAAFLLDGIAKTGEDGAYCWIVPNKLLVSQYAAPVLGFLAQHGLRRIVSISDTDAFPGTGVYPVIISGDKRTSGYCEYAADTLADLAAGRLKLRTDPGANPGNHRTFADFGIQFASGAAGFQAKLLSERISENAEEESVPFVVSGSIGKYSVNYRNVRFMGKRYGRAFIKRTDCPSERKWNLWRGEKIVIAGLTKGIEAFYGREPLALGVGVYALHAFAGFEPRFLLGLLNSKYFSWYMNVKFRERHLAGGYLAINKSTLEQLPLVDADPETQTSIAEIVDRITLAAQKTDAVRAYMDSIDQQVYRLYGLSAQEIKAVEEFPAP